MTPEQTLNRQRSLGQLLDPAPMTSTLRVVLPAKLDVQGVSKLYQLLAPLANSDGPVVLAAAAVSQVHTAGLQVLAAFVRVRAAGRAPTLWQEPSATLRAAIELAGLSAELGLDAAN